MNSQRGEKRHVSGRNNRKRRAEHLQRVRHQVTNQVLRSSAGLYIGTRCECGPYSRESGYYATEADAQKDLDANAFNRS
jgi:hypothetical protein